MCYFAGSHGIQDHLRQPHLRIEQLAKTDVQSQSDPVECSHVSVLPGFEQNQTGTAPALDQADPGGDYPGTLKIGQGGTRYVNPTHWQAVLDEVVSFSLCSSGLRISTDLPLQIAVVKEYIDLTEGPSPEDEADETLAAPDISGPVLLFGNTVPTDKTSLLAALPVRSVADRLVSVFLNSKESMLGANAS